MSASTMDELDALLAELRKDTTTNRPTESLKEAATPSSDVVIEGGADANDAANDGTVPTSIAMDLSAADCQGICAGCQEPIFSNKIMKLGEAWHHRCFRCTTCDVKLADSPVFFEHKGKPYCEKDYNNVVTPKCAYCDGDIEDMCINALGRTWHHDHFFCSQCGCAFTDGEFLEKDGKAYCEKDYFDMFAPRCGGCSKPVMDACVSALGKQWHPECFVCATCKNAFKSQYFEHSGKPYCELHYHAVQGTLCLTCQKPITGRCVTAVGNRRYHPEHFVCAYCKRQLMNTTYKETGGKFFCHTCHVKLFE